MTTILAIFGFFWALFKILAFCFLVVGILAGVFALFHPIRMDMRVRASPSGQRGEFWLSYFFGLFGLGTLASIGEQWLVLRLWKWKWKLYKLGGRERPEKPKPDRGGPTSGIRPDESGAVVEKVQTYVETPEIASIQVFGEKEEEAKESEPDIMAPKAEEPVTPIPPLEKATKPVKEKPVEEVVQPSRIDKELWESPEPPEESRKSPASPPAPPVIPPVEPPDFGSAEPEKSAEPPKDTFWKKIQNLRKKTARIFKKARWFYRQAKNIWTRFSPVLQNLFRDLWNSFEIRGPRARFRYGFEEPHLVGMFQGAVAQFAGMLLPWGVELDFTPVFVQNTILVNGEVGVTVFPWKAFYGACRLGVQPEIWRGLKDLWDWYRNRKKATNDRADPKKA